MKKTTCGLLAIGILVLVSTSAVVVYLAANDKQRGAPKLVRVACVGDSLTQSTPYPYDLWLALGNSNFTLRNFGAGGTTVSLESETPYMNTTVFREALQYKPNIVIVMLGTNDAQPSLYRYNESFVYNYVELVEAFKALSNAPKIWIVLPPPIFSNQSGRIDPVYFKQTLIPDIKQAANETDTPIIDVYSALAGFSNDFPDGVHPNDSGASIIADTIYKAITLRHL